MEEIEILPLKLQKTTQLATARARESPDLPTCVTLQKGKECNNCKISTIIVVNNHTLVGHYSRIIKSYNQCISFQNIKCSMQYIKLSLLGEFGRYNQQIALSFFVLFLEIDSQSKAHYQLRFVESTCSQQGSMCFSPQRGSNKEQICLVISTTRS